MLATRANLPGYFIQKPGDVEQNRIGSPGYLAMIHPGKDANLALGTIWEASWGAPAPVP